MIEELKRAWLNHVRGEDHFPRGMLFLNREKNGKRFPAQNFEYLFKKSLVLIGKKHIYTALFCERCLRRSVFDLIYFDLDNEKDLDSAYEDVKTIDKTFTTMNYFTAGKGFATYISFDKIRLKYPKEAMRAFVGDLEVAYGLENIDWSSVGDIERVSRLPFTVNLNKDNSEKDRLCIPISTDWSLDFILEQSEKCSTYLPVRFRPSALARNILEGYDKNVKPETFEYRPMEVKDPEEFVKHLKEEIEQILENAPNIYDGRHTFIFHGLVPRMILIGETDEEKILGLVKEFIERTPNNSSKDSLTSYLNYAKRCIKSTSQRIEAGMPIKYRMDSILFERPDLIKFFKVK